MSYPLVKNFTVGPAKLYHGVADFLCESLQNGIAEISHRSEKFSEISENTITSLRTFFHIPEEYRVYYTYSATEAMEILVRSAVTKKACHVSNGNFGNVWAKESKSAQKEVQKITHEGEKRVEVDEIFPDSDAEFLALTANETSTGIAYRPEEIAEIRKKHPHILFGIDITSAMGAVTFDFSQADAWFFSVQKALGLPAGLGILIVGPRIWEKAIVRESTGEDVGCHHCLSGLEKKMEGKFQTPTTPNVMNIAGLGYVCSRLTKDYGTLENLYASTKEKEQMIYDFFDSHPLFSPAISVGRSESVLVFKGKEEDITHLHTQLSQKGIEVGKGYGKAKKCQIRIGNFPVTNASDIANLLREIGK
ncbi:alanine--glyoxylate aminotransferase family protein [Candidatus Peregrinibacteria bacterium]|nr:MAG: alanine--glyoxylate aminotransferase family protein [Candidatus Peregrinibacteria bacterium]